MRDSDGDRLDFETLEAETLQPYRELGDPVADEVIDAIFRTGEISAVRNLLRHLVDNEELPSSANVTAGLTNDVLDQVGRFLESPANPRFSRSTAIASHEGGSSSRSMDRRS